MWFGTNGGGLCSFDAKEKRFIEFDPHNTLLPNKVIYAIEQDQEVISGYPAMPEFLRLILLPKSISASSRLMTACKGISL